MGGTTMLDFILEPLQSSRSIQNWSFEVYNELGYGFSESVYQNAMRVALAELGLLTDPEEPVHVWFHGKCVGR